MKGIASAFNQTAIGVLMLLLLVSAPVGAAEFSADFFGDTPDSVPGNGFCSDQMGFCTLRAAIMEANALPGTDVIRVHGGVPYTLSIAGADEDLGATGDLDITDSVRIESTPGVLATISGAQLDRVFDIHAGAAEVLMFGLVIRDGVVDRAGGGVRIGTAGNVTLAFTSIENNEANAGGGLSTRADRTLLQFSAVHHNRIYDAGGINVDGSGLRIFNGGTLRLESTAVYENQGGGASSIGAIDATNAASVEIFSTTISGNTNTDSPGAASIGLLGFSVDSMLLQNVTIYGHSVGLSAASAGPASLFIRNSILAAASDFACNLEDPDVAKDIDGNNLDDDGTCLFSTAPSFANQPDTDPMLEPLADYGFLTPAHVPQIGSPVVDAGSAEPRGVGNPDACFPLDQQGLTRDIDGDSLFSLRTCDIGAVEQIPNLIFRNGFEGPLKG